MQSAKEESERERESRRKSNSILVTCPSFTTLFPFWFSDVKERGCAKALGSSLRARFCSVLESRYFVWTQARLSDTISGSEQFSAAAAMPTSPIHSVASQFTSPSSFLPLFIISLSRYSSAFKRMCLTAITSSFNSNVTSFEGGLNFKVLIPFLVLSYQSFLPPFPISMDQKTDVNPRGGEN